MNAIEFQHVSFRYEGLENPILDNVDFYVKHGQIALLSGASGAGKSTLVSLILGIIPTLIAGVTDGEIKINGESVSGKKLSEICRKVGIVLQNADAQIIHQTVEDEIAFGCENLAFSANEIKNRIDTSCSMMDLQPFWRTRTLSGGQKQRLITASTLAMGQDILILDEPLANLDRGGAILLMDTLRDLAKKGYAVLVVEHRLDMVLPYVDTVWDIGGGKIRLIEDKQSYLKEQAKTIVDTCTFQPKDEIVFDFRHVGYKVKEKEILKDIDFTLSRGERMLLLGENGCGKTTLMRLAAKIIKPTKGEIIQTVQTGRKSKSQWFRKVGVVYQNPNYQLFMPTVRKEIEFSSLSPQKTEEILQLFDLQSLANRHPHSLSEGQKRKLSIAAVLASEPEVLILDEPTVGQDYSGLKNLTKLLNDWHCKAGCTMITVTHDVRCAEALCDKAVVIGEGKIKEIGGKEVISSYFAKI